MADVRTPTRGRRSLTHVGGAIEREGDPAVCAVLSEALDVAGSTSPEAERLARAHVHGFHTYPARMHPLTAQRLIAGLSEPGQVVLDPFCGSGTVVVEAALLGRAALGTDVNPLAIRLARLKARATTEATRALIAEGARAAAQVAEDRRKRKAGASGRYPREDVAAFDPHVLLALDGLRVGIDGLENRDVARDLELVLSSILVKVSRRASDTSGREVPRRIAPSFPARLFVDKTDELLRSLAETETRLAAAKAARIEEDDARELRTVASDTVDLVVTSPPYPAVYDYVEHHALRLRWLRMPSERFARGEIGAARNLRRASAAEAKARWEAELGAVLAALRRVLRPKRNAVLLIADSAIGSMPLWADEIVARVARQRGLFPLARASQERPHFHRDTERAFRSRPRREHALVLART